MVNRQSHAQAVAGLVIGASTVLATAALARRPITQSEIDVFRVANDLPERGYRAVWLPMQYGTFGTVPAVAALALVRRRPRLAVAVGLGGAAAWLSAKAVKRVVDRGRPAGLIEAVSLRGIEEGDQGFPSGHAAVSAVLTVVARPYVPDGWGTVLGALAGFVPIARLYVGAHLPLDVIGGSALGLAIGSVVNLILPSPRAGDDAF